MHKATQLLNIPLHMVNVLFDVNFIINIRKGTIRKGLIISSCFHSMFLFFFLRKIFLFLFFRHSGRRTFQT